MYHMLRLIAGGLLAAFVFGTSAQAQIVQRAVPPPSSTDCRVKVAWDWNFNLGVAEAPAAAFGGPNWSTNPTSPAAAAGATSKTLTIDVRHLVRCDRHPNENAPGDSLSIAAGTYGRGVIRTGINIIPHPNQAGHVDIYQWTAEVPVGRQGAIALEAEHSATTTLPNWSFTPIKRRGRLEVFASYPTDPDEGPQNPTPGFDDTGTRQQGTLQKSKGGQQPTDIKIRVQYNPISETTLAFVVTNQDGRADKGNLAQLTEFFLGEGEYLVPALFDEQEARDLSIAVDLTQWLRAPTPYKMNDRFVFTDGVSKDLPGFLVSTSPIRFDPEIGFVAGDLFSGTTSVLGEIDGQLPAASETSPPPAGSETPQPPAENKTTVILWVAVVVLALLLVAALSGLLRRRRA